MVIRGTPLDRLVAVDCGQVSILLEVFIPPVDGSHQSLLGFANFAHLQVLLLRLFYFQDTDCQSS